MKNFMTKKGGNPSFEGNWEREVFSGRPLFTKSSNQNESIQGELTQRGRFKGYASVFGVKDKNGDIVERGAFSDFIKRVKSGQAKMPKLLWQHDTTFPIGYIDKLKEDDYGLYIEAILLKDLQKGEEAYLLMENKIIDGLSIGYNVVKSAKIPGGRKLFQLDLLEISIVTLAANDKSTVSELKNVHLGGHMKEGENLIEELKGTVTDGVKGIALGSLNLADNFLQGKLQKFSDLLTQTEKKLMKLGPVSTYQYKRPEMSMDSEFDDYDIEKKNFENYITHGEGAGKAFNIKALNSFDKDFGGYLVPEPIAEKIYSTLASSSVIRKLSESVKISSSSLEILIDKDMANAGWAIDESVRDEHENQKLLNIKIPVHEVFSRTKATAKLLEDSSIDVEKWIINRVVEKFSSLENTAFINGDGNNKPKGFLSYETSIDYEWGKLQEVKTGEAGAFPKFNPSDVLIDLVYSLKPQYLNKACWLMPRSAVSEIRKMRDPATGRYLWQPSISANDNSTLLGYPVEICDDMPSLKKGTASKSIVFGSFRDAYQIVDRSGIQILRDPFSAKPFVEFYITKRVGGDVVNFEALKVLNFAA